MLCVLLLIRQNIWTFPIGLLYAAVTVVVLYHQRLYINLLENLYYLVMNAYGWFYWSQGRLQQNAARVDRDLATTAAPNPLPVRRLPWTQWPLLIFMLIGLSALIGWLFDTYTKADLAYWDSLTTTMSFLAMWLTARKYIDNWWLWGIVDVLYVGLYSYKGLEPYALLYALYIVLAVIGYRAWQRSLAPLASSA